MPHRILIPLAVLAGCQPASDCSFETSFDAYTPDCRGAELITEAGESRFLLPSEGTGMLTAYLPENLEETLYGGESGNYLHVILLFDDGSSAQAQQRRTTLTIGRLGATDAELHLDAVFDDGDVRGAATVPWTDER